MVVIEEGESGGHRSSSRPSDSPPSKPSLLSPPPSQLTSVVFSIRRFFLDAVEGATGVVDVVGVVAVPRQPQLPSLQFPREAAKLVETAGEAAAEAAGEGIAAVGAVVVVAAAALLLLLLLLPRVPIPFLQISPVVTAMPTLTVEVGGASHCPRGLHLLLRLQRCSARSYLTRHQHQPAVSASTPRSLWHFLCRFPTPLPPRCPQGQSAPSTFPQQKKSWQTPRWFSRVGASPHRHFGGEEALSSPPCHHHYHPYLAGLPPPPPPQPPPSGSSAGASTHHRFGQRGASLSQHHHQLHHPHHHHHHERPRVR